MRPKFSLRAFSKIRPTFRPSGSATCNYPGTLPHLRMKPKSGKYCIYRLGTEALSPRRFNFHRAVREKLKSCMKSFVPTSPKPIYKKRGNRQSGWGHARRWPLIVGTARGESKRGQVFSYQCSMKGLKPRYRKQPAHPGPGVAERDSGHLGTWEGEEGFPHSPIISRRCDRLNSIR
jgi:hypothetical protein